MNNYFVNLRLFIFSLLLPVPIWLIIYFKILTINLTINTSLLNLILISPLLEELVFRGLIQEFFTKMLRFSHAIALTNILFTLVHYIKNNSAITLLAVFISGLIFGLNKRNGIFACITLHIYYNLGLFLVINFK